MKAQNKGHLVNIYYNLLVPIIFRSYINFNLTNFIIERIQRDRKDAAASREAYKLMKQIDSSDSSSDDGVSKHAANIKRKKLG